MTQMHHGKTYTLTPDGPPVERTYSTDDDLLLPLARLRADLVASFVDHMIENYAQNLSNGKYNVMAVATEDLATEGDRLLESVGRAGR